MSVNHRWRRVTALSATPGPYWAEGGIGTCSPPPWLGRVAELMFVKPKSCGSGFASPSRDGYVTVVSPFGRFGGNHRSVEIGASGAGTIRGALRWLGVDEQLRGVGILVDH